MRNDRASLEKTLHDVEWERLVRAVADRSLGPRGQGLSADPAAANGLPITRTREGAEIALAETREALGLLEAGEPLPLDGIRDVDPHLARLERFGALDGPALRDVRETLGAARALRRFLAARRTHAPRLVEACAMDPTLDVLEDEIGGALEPDGTVADRASPDLRRLRTEVANLRARVVGKLEELVQKHADILSDRFHTMREGRYVLPVRTDAHEKLPGIVHATSQSGATVFVEPRSLIGQGNRLKMAQGEMEREEARILGILSDFVRERLAQVRAAVDALAHADLRSASARLGRDLDAVIPELDPAPRVRLEAARHPILLLDGVDVVPNDVGIEAGRALVLSGPNAGGKTVALKMLGLAALMVRAGLPVPAAEGASCGFFDPVLSDVGDEQSIATNLSTFSAHVTNVARILEAARHGAMVLLDEVATGTDPQEGAALACAIVDALCRKEAAVAVTPHYEPLKALAIRDARLGNASVGFDFDRLEPTFELALDVPGASSALEVAARFGIGRDVVDAARRMLPEQSRTFGDLVRRLEDQRRALEMDRAGVAEQRTEADRARAEVEEELASLRERERSKLSREGEKLLADIRRARGDVRSARRRLRRKRLDEAGVEEAERSVDAAAAEVREVERTQEPGEAPEDLPAPVEGELSVGSRVWVPRLKAVAEVLERPARGRVKVAAGPMKLTVDVGDVREPPDEPAAAPTAAGDPAAGGPAASERPPTADNTVDVRGLRVDEALGMVETFVDRCYGRSEPVAYVVHGVGTGALRDAIREHLGRDATYVDRTREGTPEEGGERVTVVYLR